MLLSGCRTFDPKHPLVGKPSIEPAETAIWVWLDAGIWHVRWTGAGRPHRFQGSFGGVSGSVSELTPTRPQLSSTVALVGNSVQFDVESPTAEVPSGEGFDARVVGGCARLDFYVDGHHKPDHVRLGPHKLAPHHVPFERCP
jgi:hypothetical protein